jgi:hypothetical protein
MRLPGVRHTARYKGAGARPTNLDLVTELEGDFATQHVGHLVAVAVKVERRIGAVGCGFLEQHDAVAGLATQ